MIPAVNFHLWEPCNMRCQFCFATFQDVKKSILPKGHLPQDQAIAVVKALANAGFEKITFAGGEPTLCGWLSELIHTAKTTGMTTMIVTNGTNLDDVFLEKNQNYLDWITLSIDSLLDETNLKTGRAITGKIPIPKSTYIELVDKIKSYGYGLKINTVVTSANAGEDLSSFIEYANPYRWKIFQALPIKGQNDFKIDNFLITNTEFESFIKNHNQKVKNVAIVSEDNNQMKGSYAMVDPAGRFFNNKTDEYQYSKSILKVGWKSALNEMNYDEEKFEQRGGLYKWKRKNKQVALIKK